MDAEVADLARQLGQLTLRTRELEQQAVRLRGEREALEQALLAAMAKEAAWEQRGDVAQMRGAERLLPSHVVAERRRQTLEDGGTRRLMGVVTPLSQPVPCSEGCASRGWEHVHTADGQIL